ncbi:MAG: hypothetical protein JSR82_00265 [Verrucomicrobia bacterium]|nr:hypothetical protein [Verrucomicrobiota bacterium]
MRRLLALPLLLLAGSAFAQDVGKLPYATVDENIKRVVGDDKGKVAVRLTVACRKAGVKPEEITLTLDSKIAPKTFRLGPDRAIYDFPQTEELLKENPLLVTNQPRGTIDLSVEIGVPVPEATSISYGALVRGLTQLNETSRKSLGTQGAPLLNATKLAVHFGTDGATVTVPEKGGKKTTLKADGLRIVLLPIDPALDQEGATVTFSTRPIWIAGSK